MDQLKGVLIKIVDDLERSAVGIAVLASGTADKQTAREVAYQENKDFYESIRKQIRNLPGSL